MYFLSGHLGIQHAGHVSSADIWSAQIGQPNAPVRGTHGGFKSFTDVQGFKSSSHWCWVHRNSEFSLPALRALDLKLQIKQLTPNTTANSSHISSSWCHVTIVASLLLSFHYLRWLDVNQNLTKSLFPAWPKPPISFIMSLKSWQHTWKDNNKNIKPQRPCKLLSSLNQAICNDMQWQYVSRIRLSISAVLVHLGFFLSHGLSTTNVTWSLLVALGGQRLDSLTTTNEAETTSTSCIGETCLADRYYAPGFPIDILSFVDLRCLLTVWPEAKDTEQLNHKLDTKA